MNERDQNRYQRHRSEQQRGGQGSRNQPQGRYGSMPEPGERQQSRGFTDTYNPEPQWLHEDSVGQRHGQPLGGSDYDRNDEGYRGSRYATTGQARSGYRDDDRGYGEPMGRQYGAGQQRGGQAGSMDYGRDYPRDRGYGQGMAGRWDEDHPEAGQGHGAHASHGSQYGSSRFDEPGRGGYERSGYGTSGYGTSGYRQSAQGGQGYGQDYGRDQAQRGGRSGLQFASDYGGGGYDQVSGGYGYRGHLGQATGSYQSGMEGQRSYRGLGPQTYKRSDDRIRDDVCERLTDDAGIDASNITIDVNQGAVTLSGTVPERHMRYAAEDLVDDALGVESINNQLRVQSQGMQSQGTQSQGMSSSSDTTMASGSRATAPSDIEKQKH